MISADEKPWNSATTLYIARKIEEISGGRSLKILDAGCGDGVVLEQLLGYGHTLYGFDLGRRKQRIEDFLRPILKDEFESRIRIAPDERTIPFEDESFDVVYANQVFEHVRFLDRMFEECARVLRPGGTLITLFPLATYPIEGHLKIPFAHWIPPGRLRLAYLKPFYYLRLRPRRPGLSARETAEFWNNNLRTNMYYRFMNEIQALSEYYFESMTTDTDGYIRAKIDLLRARGGLTRRAFARTLTMLKGNALNYLVTHGFSGTFVLNAPRRLKLCNPQPVASH